MSKLIWADLTLLAAAHSFAFNFSTMFKCCWEILSFIFTNIMPCNALICGSTQYKDTCECLKASVYISSLSLWCPFAGVLLLLVFPQSSSVTELSVTSTLKLEQSTKKHQIVTRVKREAVRSSAWDSHSFIHPSHLPFYPCQTIVALWPHSSVISVEQLVSIRTPF